MAQDKWADAVVASAVRGGLVGTAHWTPGTRIEVLGENLKLYDQRLSREFIEIGEATRALEKEVVGLHKREVDLAHELALHEKERRAELDELDRWMNEQEAQGLFGRAAYIEEARNEGLELLVAAAK